MFRLVQPENGLINCCYILNKQLLHTTDIYWSLKKLFLYVKRDMKISPRNLILERVKPSELPKLLVEVSSSFPSNGTKNPQTLSQNCQNENINGKGK